MDGGRGRGPTASVEVTSKVFEWGVYGVPETKAKNRKRTGPVRPKEAVMTLVERDGRVRGSSDLEMSV